MPWKNDQVSEFETSKILELAKDCLKIDGDYVELGCYRGDTSLLLADMVKSSGKRLWIYDSFEGLPEKTLEDDSVLGRDFQKGVLNVTKREVKERFLRAGLPVPIIKKAWFAELKEVDLPEKIALAFLHGDLYESIRDSLKLVENKMVPGGVIMVHDYNNSALPGVARAVNEWLKGKNPMIQRCQSMITIML
jgi:O-methyltransferase